MAAYRGDDVDHGDVGGGPPVTGVIAGSPVKSDPAHRALYFGSEEKHDERRTPAGRHGASKGAGAFGGGGYGQQQRRPRQRPASAGPRAGGRRPMSASSQRSAGTGSAKGGGRSRAQRPHSAGPRRSPSERSGLLGRSNSKNAFGRPGSASPAFDSPTRVGLRRMNSAHFGFAQRWRTEWQPEGKGVRPNSAQLAEVGTTLGHQMLAHLSSGSFAHMSSSTRDEHARAAGQDMGGNDMVGPGSYAAPGSLGKQPLSVHRTMPRMDFTTAKRIDDNMGRRSPGPVYTAVSYIGNDKPVDKSRAPKFSFGTSTRIKNYRSMSPGPIYNVKYNAFATNLGRRGGSVGFTRAKRF